MASPELPMSDLPEPVRRRDATMATMTKYRHREHDWQAGIHCVAMARFHLRQLGHRPPTLPRIRSYLAAVRTLRQRGWQNCSDMLDALLPRRTPAALRLGDLAVAPSADGIGSIVIFTGSKLLGWADGVEGMAVMEIGMGDLLGAWTT